MNSKRDPARSANQHWRATRIIEVGGKNFEILFWGGFGVLHKNWGRAWRGKKKGIGASKNGWGAG